jgi:hypothetical protein
MNLVIHKTCKMLVHQTKQEKKDTVEVNELEGKCHIQISPTRTRKRLCTQY